MRLINIYGREQYKNVEKYRVDWDAKCRSKIQFTVKTFLRQYWQNHIVYEEFPVYGTRLKVDLLNASNKIAVEVQGKQHEQFNKHFHANSRLKYLQSIKRDVKKSQWLERNGFIVVEIMQDEVPTLNEDFFLKKYDITLV